MAVSSKAGTFTIASGDTVGTTQQITVGFQPKVIFFWTTGHSSATDAVTNQTARVAFGAATSTTNRGSVGSISRHDSATIDGGRAYDNRYCLVIPQSNPAGIEGALDISAIDSTSFTVIVDDQFVVTVRISYLALGGSDITDAVVGDYNAPVATGNADITSLAFQPDFLLMFGCSTTSSTNGASVNRSFINVGAAAGASNQAVIEIGEGPESNATSQARSYAYSGEIYAAMADTPTTVASRAAFVSFLSNGFRLNWLEAAAAYRVFYVAIKGGLWTVGDLLTQTDTSTTIVESGFGFTPNATMLFSHSMAQSTQDTVQNNARLSIGAFTSTSERVAQAFLSETGLADMRVVNAVEYDEVYANVSAADPSTIQGLMDVQSVDSGGFTLIMDDADPSQSFVWYFSVGAVGGTQFTQSVSGGVSSGGVPLKRAQAGKAGGVAASGTQVRRTASNEVGAVGASGGVVRRTGKGAFGSVAAAATVAMVRIILKALSGAVAAAATVARMTIRSTVGSVSAGGSLTRRASKLLSGGIAAGATLLKLVRKTLVGSISESGTLSAARTVLLALVGGISTSGVVVRRTAKAFGGSVISSGTVARQVAKLLVGSIGTSAIVASLRLFVRSLAGSVGASGLVIKRSSKSMAGSVAAGATLVKVVIRSLSGVVAASSTLSSLRAFFKSLVGSIGVNGSVTKRTNSSVFGAVGSSAGVFRRTGKPILGGVTASATLQSLKTFLRTVGGAISTSGSVVLRTIKSIGGDVSTNGGIVRSIVRQLAGGISAAATVQAIRLIMMLLAGGVTAGGNVAKSTSKWLIGSVALVSARVRRTLHGVVGLVGVTGGIAKRSYLLVFGMVATSGTVIKLFSLSLFGSIGVAGTILKWITRLLSGSVSSFGTLAALVSGVSAAVGSTRLRGTWQAVKFAVGKFVNSKRLSGRHDDDNDLSGSF